MYKQVLFTKESALGHYAEPPASLIRPGHTKLAETDTPLHPQLQEYIQNLRPDSGKTYVLVSAMGAGEYYGDNINGDYFPYKELVTHTPEWLDIPVSDIARRKQGAMSLKTGYPTFYLAHAFKHHVNKDPARSFGDIECAVWNEKMKRVELVISLEHSRCEQMGAEDVLNRINDGQYPDVSMGCRVPYDVCFPPGTLIQTSRGIISIEDVSLGEKVLTHTGNFRRVTNLHKRDYRDVLIGLKVYGSCRTLSSTRNHPILVLPRDEVRQPAGRRRDPKEISSDPSWISAEDVRVGDYLLRPVESSQKGPTDISFFWASPTGVMYYASPIVEIESSEYEGLVYNLQVDEDESYVAEGWAVHNCSICGNKARNKAEYCEHINNRRIDKDPLGNGQRPYMINISPRFFDLSFVFIGADKTARTLMKIAGIEDPIFRHINNDLHQLFPHQEEELVKVAHDLYSAGYDPYDHSEENIAKIASLRGVALGALTGAGLGGTRYYLSRALEQDPDREPVGSLGVNVLGGALGGGLWGAMGSAIARNTSPHPKDSDKILMPILMGMGGGGMGSTVSSALEKFMSGEPAEGEVHKKASVSPKVWQGYGRDKMASMRSVLRKVAELQKQNKHMKLSDIIKYVVPNPRAKEVSRIEGGEPDMPESLQDDLGRAGMDTAVNSTARRGIVMKPHEFMRVVLQSAGLGDIADKLRGVRLPSSDKVEMPCSVDPGKGSTELEEKLAPMEQVRGIKPIIIRKRIIRIMMVPTSHMDESGCDSCEDGQEEKEERMKNSPLLDKVSAAYNGYRLWLIANAPELGMTSDEGTDFSSAFATGQMSKSAAADRALTAAYLQHAHWQAGGS